MNPSTRAVIYVGFECNIKCKFCYYKNHTGWRKLFYLILQALIFRFVFGDTKVDITGGEPTVYPHIIRLVKFCKLIGLRPTIITNGIALGSRKKVESLKNAGLFDFLISIHGLDEVYNYTVDIKNAFAVQAKAINNLNDLKIPFRANVTITKLNYKQLVDIAKYCINIGAKVVNFISFNPFSDWKEISEIDFQEKHSTIAPYLKDAIDHLSSKGIETNVRYFPFCQIKKYEKYQQNFSQVIYDSHEWDYASSSKRKNPWYFVSFIFNKHFLKKSHKDQEQSLIKQSFIARKNHCKHTQKCNKCALNKICDGLTNQYLQRYGDNELSPYDGELIKEIDFFMKQQDRYID